MGHKLIAREEIGSLPVENCDSIIGVIADTKYLQIPTLKRNDLTIFHNNLLIRIREKIHTLKTLIRNGYQWNCFRCHICLLKVAVVGRMIKMMVCVDHTSNRLAT